MPCHDDCGCFCIRREHWLCIARPIHIIWSAVWHGNYPRRRGKWVPLIFELPPQVTAKPVRIHSAQAQGCSALHDTAVSARTSNIIKACPLCDPQQLHP